MFIGLPWWHIGKNLPVNAGDPGVIPDLEGLHTQEQLSHDC